MHDKKNRLRKSSRSLRIVGFAGSVCVPSKTRALVDLIDPVALAGKPVLLTATGGGDKRALVIEHQLRPLFGFFETLTLPTDIYVSGADFSGGVPASQPLLARIDRAVSQFPKGLQYRPAGTAA